MNAKISRGSVFQGKYEVIKQLGAGLYTAVYLTRSLEDNKLLALKLYKGPYEDNRIFQRRFENEVALAGQFSHPNLVRYIASGFTSNGTPYAIMDYIEGKTVADLLVYHGRVPVSIALRIINEVLQALAFLHARGIVHRDIKPSAIFVDFQGNVKLADFDIAKKIHNDEQLTAKDAVIGSKLYMSPEQRESGFVDARSDIFSTGITLYEMITGKNPWVNSDFIPSDERAWTKFTRPSKLAPDAGPDIDDLIFSAMKRQPGHRYKSADVFLKQLHEFQWASKNDLIQWARGRKINEADIAPKRSMKLNPMLIIAVAVLLLLALALTLWLVTGDPTVTPTPLP